MFVLMNAAKIGKKGISRKIDKLFLAIGLDMV
jgi:hypothetical protein